MRQTSYKTKAILPREGALHLKLKVSSRYGTSFEKGHSFSLNVQRGRQFMISKILTQVAFGHLKHIDANAYKYLINNYEQDTFTNSLNLKFVVLDYYYQYPDFSKIYKYKSIKSKHKQYVQVWKKDSKGRYLFNNRYRTKYDNHKKLENKSNQLGVF